MVGRTMYKDKALLEQKADKVKDRVRRCPDVDALEEGDGLTCHAIMRFYYQLLERY